MNIINRIGDHYHSNKYVFDLDCKTQLVSDVFRFEQYEEKVKKLLKKLKYDNLIKNIKQTNHSKKNLKN